VRVTDRGPLLERNRVHSQLLQPPPALVELGARAVHGRAALLRFLRGALGRGHAALLALTGAVELRLEVALEAGHLLPEEGYFLGLGVQRSLEED
jgi:hypothetical protein